MKQAIRALMIAVLISGMLAGCSGESGSADSPAQAEAPPAAADADAGEQAEPGGDGPSGEITVASWNVGADSLKEIGEAYMALNPGATITVQYVDGEYEKLRPALAAGTGVPDVFSTQKADFPAFMNTYGDQFADVTDAVGPERDNFAAEAISQVEAGGSYYAFPWDNGPSGMFYHKGAFEEAGIDPLSLTTWDKYIEAGKAIKEATGRYMWATTFNGSGIDEAMLLFHQQGGRYYDDDGRASLGSPEMLRAFDYLLRMKEEELLADIPDAWNDRIKVLAEDKLASVPYAVWFAGTMVTSVENGAGEWGIAPLPAFEEGGNNMVGLGGSVLAIYKNSDNVALAKDYLRFACMTEEGGAINLKYGLFAAYKPNHQAAAYSEVDPYFGVAVGETFAQWVDAPAIDYGAYYTDVQAEFKVAAGEILLNGKDPAAALDEASDRAQRAIDAARG